MVYVGLPTCIWQENSRCSEDGCVLPYLQLMSDWKINGQCARLTGIHGNVVARGNPFPLMGIHGNVGAPVPPMPFSELSDHAELA